MGKNKISEMQLISIGCCYLLGTIVVSVFLSSVAGNESWLIGFLSGFAFIPVLLVYFSLAKRFPGKSLFEINEAVLGRFWGRALSLIYLVFMLTLCALNILEASNFLHYFIIPKTSLVVIASVLMLCCVYCARKGLMPLAQVATIFGLLSLAGIFANLILSLGHVSFKYLLPVFNLEPLDYVQSMHIITSIPLGESFILFFFVPDLSEKASFKKAFIIVIIFSMIIITLIHMREVTSLGTLIKFTTLPSYEAVRMIDFGGNFSRTESLFALLLISLTFFKTLILFHLCAKGAEQVFRLKSSHHLLPMLAAFLVIYAVNAYGSASNNIFWGKNVSPFIWTFFTFVLPLLTLIIAVAKGARSYFFLKEKVSKRTF